MAVYSSQITQVGEVSTAIPERLLEPRYCLRWTFETNQSVYIVSHFDVVPLLPGGAVYLVKSQIGGKSMPALSSNAGFRSGKATINNPTYEIVDKDGELSSIISDKAVNGIGTLNTKITDWEFEKGDASFHLKNPVYTGFVQNHSKPFNTLIIDTVDINHHLDDEIFEPIVWRLNADINDSQGIIGITLNVLKIPDNQVLFEHSAQYLANPSETVGYFKIGDELCSYTALVNVGGVATFTGVKRGVLGTIAAAVSGVSSKEPENRETVTEWSLIDETGTGLIYALVHGVTRDGRVLPEHWHIDNNGTHIIDAMSFAAYANPKRLLFQNIGKVKCRDFYQKEILTPLQSVIGINGRGNLQWLPRIRPTDEDSGEIVLDASNCVSTNQMTLIHDKSDIYTSIKILYDYNAHTKQYLSEPEYYNPDSASFNKTKRTKTFKFKGLHAGLHTNSEIESLATSLGDDLYYERLSFTLESYINNIPLGTLVSVDFENVIDDTNSTVGHLKRTMQVVSSNYNRATQTSVYELSSSLNKIAKLRAGQQQHNVSIDEYKRGRVNIATLPGISIANGIATGSITLNMNTAYYYVDDNELGTGLEFSDALNVTIQGYGPHLFLAVFGPFINKTTLDFTAHSRHQGGDRGRFVSGAEVLPKKGDTGYVIGTRATGELSTKRLYTTHLSSNADVYNRGGVVVGSRGKYPIATPAVFSQAPLPVLNLNDGILGGYPADMGGCGGSGGRASRHYDAGRRPTISGGSTVDVPSTQWIDGSSGGWGGGGLIIMSWGGGVVGNGKIILNGSDASPAQHIDIAGSRFMGARGSGGGPGSLLWIVDGYHQPPLMTSANVIAFPGDNSVNATEIKYGKKVTIDDTYKAYGHAGTPYLNYWESVSRIVYTPASQALEPLRGLFDSLAISRQRDGKIKLYPNSSATTPPSDGLPGDIAIWEAALDGDNPEPPGWIMDDDYIWQPITDWSDLESDYATLLFVHRKYGGTESILSATRPVGKAAGTHWLNSTDGTEWILGETEAGDVLFRQEGVPVGIELLNNGNFAEGETGYILTRDENLLPVNILNQAIDAIAEAFITHGAIEGEYIEDFEDTGTITVSPITSLVLTAESDTSIRATWTQPGDITGIESQEIWFNGAVYAVTITGSTYVISGLTAGLTYTIGVGNVGTNGTRSSVISDTQATTDSTAPAGQRGIVLTKTGELQGDGNRLIQGVAYENAASVVIASSRGIQLTLIGSPSNDEIVASVGVGGSFSFLVDNTYDSHLGGAATIYTNNSDNTTQSTITFTYEA